MQNLYESDFHAWALQAAEQLREGRLSEADMAHVAEEIESLANKEQRELRSRLARILEHLLKLRLAEGAILDQNRRIWTRSAARQQVEISTLLEQSPSLKDRIPELLPKAWRDAARIVEAEQITSRRIPKTLPFTLEEVLGHL